MSRLVRKLARLPSGLALPYLDQSSRGSPALLFLHGLTDSCRSYEPVLAHLPQTMRAVAPTLRGHADASIPDTYCLTDFAADLRSFLDVLSLEQVVLVGHSMGAAIAQRFAIDHPDRVLGVVSLAHFRRLGVIQPALLSKKPRLLLLRTLSILRSSGRSRRARWLNRFRLSFSTGSYRKACKFRRGFGRRSGPRSSRRTLRRNYPALGHRPCSSGAIGTTSRCAPSKTSFAAQSRKPAS